VGVDPAATPSWLDGRVEIGVRIPADGFMLEVIERTGPLLVTSANLHGRETPEDFRAVLEGLDGTPELAVDGGPRMTVPSTLVNCNLPAPVVERAGVISAQRVREVLG
jgi:L-threonylcarbamoyladenylate synthase